MKKFSIAFAAALTLCNVAIAQPVSVFQYLVGDWDQVGSGRTVSISRFGNVSTNSGGLQGRVGDSIYKGSNFTFEGSDGSGSYYCAYNIVFLRGRVSTDWRLVDSSPNVRCPRGVFTKTDPETR